MDDGRGRGVGVGDAPSSVVVVVDGGVVVFVFVVVAELGARTQSKEWGEELAAAPWKERRHVAADAVFLSREEEAVMVHGPCIVRCLSIVMVDFVAAASVSYR